MDAVPLEVGKETIQPSPKIIVSIEFSGCAVCMLCKVSLGFGGSR